MLLDNVLFISSNSKTFWSTFSYMNFFFDLQQLASSRCSSNIGLRIKLKRRSVFWKGHRLKLKEKLLSTRSLLLWNMVSTMWPISLSRFEILYRSNFFELFLSRLDNNGPQTSLCRTKLSWLSLPMTWIQLNWLYGSLHFAGKWRSHIVLWRGRLDWELWVAFYRVVSRLHKRCICSNWFNILFIMNANCRLSIKRLPPFCAWPLWRMRTSWTSARF